MARRGRSFRCFWILAMIQNENQANKNHADLSMAFKGLDVIFGARMDTTTATSQTLQS